MASITDIKRKILELSPAQFQEFCDTLLSKMGYGLIHSYGLKEGTANTTVGNPDTYFRKDNGKYVFITYTIQQSSVYSKLKEDIEKCLDPHKTGLAVTEIDEIISCHTSSNLSAGDDMSLHELCGSLGIRLTIIGIDEIANQVHNHYRLLAKDYLNLSIDTNQILSIDDFIIQYDANKMSAPLNTIFQYREEEIAEIIDALDKNVVAIVMGKAGVGKTRLVLEATKRYASVQGYTLLCVKNNNLGLYEDLVSATEQTGKYLFFIDDANELAELEQILEYTIKNYLGYTVKVIVTVRDYVKDKVISIVSKYALPKIISILPLSEEQIEGFLNRNLGIRNEEYIKQINRIAQGNPRMAYMAGRLAVEKQNLYVIKDASNLYDAYYKEYVNDSFENDRSLCIVTGILSVVNVVMLNDLSVLHDILDNFNVSSDDFTEKLRLLARLEMVEIQLDNVASLSDQCLANYMLYYVFYEKKMIPLADVLSIGFKFFRRSVIKAIDTILNLFGSENTRDYSRQEVMKVWNGFKNQQDPCFEDFVKVFHTFKPGEAFLIAQDKVNHIQPEKINVHNTDFTKNCYCAEEEVLEFLTGYKYSEDIDYAMEILLQFSGKKEETLISGYKWLEDNYGIDMESYKYEYYTQKKVGAYLYKEIENENVIAMAIGLQWTRHALAFAFHPIEIRQSNRMVSYYLEVKNTKGVKEYRHLCWSVLLTLAGKKDWREKVILALEEYVNRIQTESNREIALSDLEDVEHLVSVLECNRIGFLKVIQKLLYKYSKWGIECDKKWNEKLNGEIWNIYHLLENDFTVSGLGYEDYEEERNRRIEKYGKECLTKDMRSFVHSLNDILSDPLIKREAYDINQGIELIIRQFDEEHLLVFLDEFIKGGEAISIQSSIVLGPLNRTGDSIELFSNLRNACFPQQNDWLFGFFETLPNEKVSSEMLAEFLRFLRDDSDRYLRSSALRKLRVLDKFLELEPNIYPIACNIILEKGVYSYFIIMVYFQSLFNENVYSPQELFSLFQNNLALLQDVYCCALRCGELIDYNGAFLSEFLVLGDSWLQKYSEVFWDNAKESKSFNLNRNKILWKSEDFIKFYDYLFYNCPYDTLHNWKKARVFKELLTYTGSDEIISQRQQEWMSHIIIENALSDYIVSVFDIVCELGDDMRRNAIKTFINNNSDVEMFMKLSLFPSHGSGSLAAEYYKRIDFFKSLLEYVSGLQFLKHRVFIENEMDKLKKQAKEAEARDIYRNLYMQ